MPHQDPQGQMMQITRLLDNSAASPKANPAERLRGFVLATEGYPVHIMRRAVNNFISGTTDPKADPNWPLQPAHLANECRRLHTASLDDAARTRLALAQIRERETPFHQEPPEVRRAAVAAAMARLSPAIVAPAAAAQKDEQQAAARRTATHDARFVDPSPEATKSRLLKPRS